MAQPDFSDDAVWCESLLSVDSKSGLSVPMRLSNFQAYYLKWRKNSKSGRRVIVKTRQIMASTIIKAKNLKDMTQMPGIKVLTLTHHDLATDLFRIRVRQWCDQLENLGQLPRVAIDNADILSFKGLNSSMVFTTAGGKLGGKAGTYNRVHASEVAWWVGGDPGKMIGSILPSVPQWPDGEVDLESTPAGAEGPLHDFYADAKAGENEWDFTFWEWWKQEEYTREVPPEFVLNQEETILKEKHNLTLGQISWRRWQIGEMRRTGAREDGKGLFPQEYPEDDITCFMAGSDLVLDEYALTHYINLIRGPQIIESGWDIWELPIPGEVYVIGADSSEGKSDYSAAWVVHVPSLRCVARFHHKVIPHEFADALHSMGKKYNEALLTVETPGPGTAVLERLIFGAEPYHNVYFHIDEFTGKVADEPGWPQNIKTRNNLMSAGQKYTKALAYQLYDERTVRELASLTWRQLGRMRRAEAAPGAHDDLVFALFLALITTSEALLTARGRQSETLNNPGTGSRVQRIGMGY